MNILIAGCGYVGLRLAGILHGSGHQVFGLRRNPEGLLPFLNWCRGDLTSSEPLALPEPIDAVVLTAGLRSDTEDRYRSLFVDGYARLINQLFNRATPPRRLVMVSTTGVFAESDGGRVDESSAVDDHRTPSRYYLAAEKTVLSTGAGATVVRLSGIYGPGRFRLIREVRERRAFHIPPPAHYLNHLHTDDAAGAIAHILALGTPAPIYIASDLEPADRNDVLQWISHHLGMGDIPVAHATDARPGRRSGNKRCDSSLLVRSGFQFRFPTYREGYARLISDGN